MKSKKPSNVTRIPASELTEITTWRLPTVGGRHVVRTPFSEKEGMPGAPVKAEVEEVEAEPLTLEAIEQIRQQAYQDGLKQGHDEGYAKGEQEGRSKGEELGYQTGFKRGEKDVNALKSQLGELLHASQAPVQRYQQEVEAVLLQLVEQVACAVIKKELSTRPELVKTLVEEALNALPRASDRLQLTAHPADLSLVEEIRDHEQGQWDIVSDTKLSPGSLVIRGANSYLDYSLQSRLAQVLETLLDDGPSSGKSLDGKPQDVKAEHAGESAAQDGPVADITEPPLGHSSGHGSSGGHDDTSQEDASDESSAEAPDNAG